MTTPRIIHPARATAVICALVIFLLATRIVLAADLVQRRSTLASAYAEQLADLARTCEVAGADAQARMIARWRPPADAAQLVLFLPGTETAAGTTRALAGSAAAADCPQWRQRFQVLRRVYAAQLWPLARQAAAAGRGALAIQLANEVLREQPDQDAARRALGYVQYDGRWTTAMARDRHERGLVWHSRFGWIRAGDVEAYDEGRRRAGDSWIDLAEDARRHNTMRTGWRIETDHYLVTTNHSLEAGVELAGQLEQLYAVWSQVFADYYLDRRQLAHRFAPRTGARAESPAARRTAGRAAGRRFRVDYFRTRAEYTAALRHRQPLIGKTLGIYFGSSRRGYFFAGSQQDRGTLWHEAAHQLFHETRPVAAGVGRRDNFWIVEGIAAYMESLAQRDGYWTLGGPNAGRLPAARRRLLQDGFYVPLGQLVRMNIDSIQHHDQIRKLYSQMAGAATFLMHGQGGRYRPALMRYLRAVYSGRTQAGTLAKLTGVGYDELDRQYREFLEGGGTKRMTKD